MGEVVEFKSRREDGDYNVLHCPLCDGDRFRVIYSYGKPYHHCIGCYTMFPKWPHDGEPT
jgi:hypothetical protein